MKKRSIVLLAFGVACLGALVWYSMRTRDTGPVFESVKVERGAVHNVVSVTGHVEPVTRLTLSFPAGGTIASIVDEGTTLVRGENIARLDVGDLNASLREAEARVAREQAVLAGLMAPLRTEERALKQAALDKASSGLALAEENARTVLAKAFTVADDAIREEADELFSDASGAAPSFGIRFSYGTTDYIIHTDAATESGLNAARARVTDLLAGMKERAQAGDVRSNDLLLTESDLVEIESFLNTLANAVNKYVSKDTQAQSVYETFQTSVASARTAISGARADVVASRKELDAATSAMTLAERDLELAEAGASPEARRAQQAAVAAAQESVAGVSEMVGQRTLHAPISGTIARVLPKVGEALGAYQPVAELLSDGAFEVEAYIPEADIARVKIGDAAQLTFDALPRTDVYTGEVVRMSLSETVREGVPTYKTTLVLEVPDDVRAMLRPGMTTDTDITTDTRENVLYVPARSVLTDKGRTYVRVVTGKTFEERTVTTGLHGSDGTVEILSGLEEGEDVVLYVEEQ